MQLYLLNKSNCLLVVQGAFLDSRLEMGRFVPYSLGMCKRTPRQSRLSKFSLVDSRDRYCSPKQDSNLGPSRIAIFRDCKATALTTQPPWLVFLLAPILSYKARPIFNRLQDLWNRSCKFENLQGKQLSEQIQTDRQTYSQIDRQTDRQIPKKVSEIFYKKVSKKF